MMKSFVLLLICLTAVIVQFTIKDYGLVMTILYIYVIVSNVWPTKK